MFPFDGKYLKVLTPVTIDGRTPKTDENDTKVFKESHSPLTARKYLDKYNDSLPKELKLRITEVDSDAEKISPEAQEVIKNKKRSTKKEEI